MGRYTRIKDVHYFPEAGQAALRGRANGLTKVKGVESRLRGADFIFPELVHVTPAGVVHAQFRTAECWREHHKIVCRTPLLRQERTP